MTKLEELIKELCPNGVEDYPIETLCNIVIAPTKLKTNQYLYQGQYPIIDQGQEQVVGYTNNEQALVPFNEYVLFGDHTREVKYINGKFAQGADGLKILKSKSIIVPKYLYYCMSNFKVRSRGYSRHWGLMKQVQIPLPPLAVQCEIVRILDDFTEEVKALQCKLQEELDARRKQYEYYRGKLLSFDKLNSEYKVRWLRIGDVCAVSAGGDIPKDCVSSKQSSEYPVPIISNGIGANAIYGYTSNAKITEPAVTVAARGTIGYAEYRVYPYYPIIRLLSCIPLDTNKLNTKYLYYCLQGKQYPVPTGGIPQLIAPELKKVQIPVPPLEVQEKIVETLDKFDKLCNDLSEGLPAEIEARQKQYEYYRDKLLSFKEYV